MKKIRSGFIGMIALLSANIGFKDFCTKFHMRVMVKKVHCWVIIYGKSVRDITVTLRSDNEVGDIVMLMT